jgi:hypothetical protein
LTSASTTESCGGLTISNVICSLAERFDRLAQVFPALAGERELLQLYDRQFAELEQVEAVVVIVRQVRLEHFVEDRNAVLRIGEAAEIQDRPSRHTSGPHGEPSATRRLRMLP